ILSVVRNTSVFGRGFYNEFFSGSLCLCSELSASLIRLRVAADNLRPHLHFDQRTRSGAEAPDLRRLRRRSASGIGLTTHPWKVYSGIPPFSDLRPGLRLSASLP